MIYLWKTPDDWPPEWIAQYDRTQSVDRFTLLRPTRLNGSPTIRVELPASATIVSSWQCIPNTARVPIVSEQIREVMSKHAPLDCQFLPATVDAAGHAIDGFYAVVVTTAVRAIDRSRSTFTRVPGTQTIMQFGQLTLASNPLGTALLGRDPEYLPLLFVSERVAKALAALSPKGVSFEKV